MNSHGQSSNAARGIQGISAYASLGCVSGARPASYSFVVVVLQVVIILLAQSG